MEFKKVVKYSVGTVVGLVAPVVAFANQVSDGLTSISNNGGFGGFSSPLTQAQSPSQLAVQIINLMLMFAGIVAVFFIIVGGYQYMTAGGNSEQAEKGRTSLVNAIIGIVIIVLAYVIVNVIVNLVGNGVA